MIRLGLRLTLSSGREGITRLIATALAVAVGVTVLLAVLGDYHAFQAGAARQCWECTHAADLSNLSLAAPPADAELWNYSEDYFKGQTVERLDVAALGDKAPAIPGLAQMPGPGRYDVSPAMAALLAGTPHDQLGDRFPGRQAGVLADAALTGPDELVIVVGYTPAQLAAIPGTGAVDKIDTAPRAQGTTSVYRLGFGLGAIAMVLPMLVLVGTATRLSAARREERYAALRLVGAKARQINVMASVDAAIGAILGTALGIGVFLLIRPQVAKVSITGAKVFGYTVAPTAAEYVAVLLLIPIIAAAAAVWSLRRVKVSPLGVSRRTTPPPPRAWRLIPLLIGAALFVAAVGSGGSDTSPAIAFPSFVLVMFGLVIAGPWLTMKCSVLLAALAKGAPSLLAARRLADNPRAAFRTVSGLMLAVFVGTAIGTIVSTGLHASTGGTRAQLNDVLRVGYNISDGPRPDASNANDGLSPRLAAQTISALQSYRGVSVIAIYALPASAQTAAHGNGGAGQRGPDPNTPPAPDSVISCAALRELPVLGTCPSGAQAVELLPADLFTDNPLAMQFPIVTGGDPAYSGGLADLRLNILMVRTGDAATLERVRTYLAVHIPPLAGANVPAGGNQPQTFGEVAQVRQAAIEAAQRVIFLMIGLTLLVAGCSLAVAMGGGLIERKRPFILLRLSGTASRSLYLTVLLESLLPLVATALLAAVTGLVLAIPIANALAHGAPLQLPGHAYGLTMAGGLAVCLAVIALTLPLLGRITASDNARFE
ncbi:FtsX-like permease family protein [Actinocrinis sp.]|uniref:FtsX-like permease family protein n=1 Tax=Actinocrinis sp. TaxID=1920516 RepID=UPI002D4C889D|nr:FtsX-like permease family protein [Actinocrinis sp.]HZP53436.1 FtsX-like permease family protein [Actinocrinis sp.]